MKRTSASTIGMISLVMLMGASVSPASAGVVNEGFTIMDGIVDDWCSSDSPDIDDGLDLFESLVLIGGWGERLDTSGNGKPFYTVFAPFDTSIETVLDELGTSIAELSSTPAVVAAILADHIANGSFEKDELENPNLTRITMRSGYVATISTSNQSGDRTLYTDVSIAGQFVDDGHQFDNGMLFCLAGFIDTTPQVPTDGLNALDNFQLTWTSPTSPISSKYLLFKLDFTIPLATALTANDFGNLGTLTNCLMNPISANGTDPTYTYYLVVSCAGTGTVQPTLTRSQIAVRDGNTQVMRTFTGSNSGSVIDIVNGFVLTVEKIGSGQGTIASNISGVDCGSMCVGVFEKSTRITLTPQPAPGSVFVGWSGACTGRATCQLTVAASMTATARFELATKVTVVGVGNGAGTVSSTPAGVNCATSSGSSCSGTIAPGTQVVLQARANRGSRFLGWMGACSGTGPCTFTTQSPGQVIHAFAIFERP